MINCIWKYVCDMAYRSTYCGYVILNLLNGHCVVVQLQETQTTREPWNMQVSQVYDCAVIFYIQGTFVNTLVKQDSKP